ncbi:MAG: hypothetical protein K8I29_12770 [Alphaproteobacteria bacterium]|uniref:AMP-activated protein kinase glycogen-binding domain-containing protein n=1 Tax=Candidatus Nitrobium versatile TaxID=2884831 RepID=A0A953JDF0_9BACT|nr:hypothetical protein [Candidatus Nitrobium versatile]
MSGTKDLIHKMLDGEISPEEKGKIDTALASDLRLQEELALLQKTVSLIGECGREPVPESFTAEVMKKLPVQIEPVQAKQETKPKRRTAFFDFLFRQRTIRWNVASAAVALSLLLVLSGGFTLLFQEKRSSFSPSPVPSSASAVTFTFHAPHAETVSIAGDFNRWSEEQGTMKREPNGLWTIEIPLPPGTYQYMFVVDGKTWVPDPRADVYRDDGFGNRNSVVRISTL